MATSSPFGKISKSGRRAQASMTVLNQASSNGRPKMMFSQNVPTMKRYKLNPGGGTSGGRTSSDPWMLVRVGDLSDDRDFP